VRGSVRAWIPATVVAVLLAIGVGTAAYFTLGRSTSGSASPTPTVDLHSAAAVMAAIRHYYEVEDRARESGNPSLIDSVTIGHDSLASQNFQAFISDQTAKGKRSVTVANYYSDWSVSLSGDQATAGYIFWARGHDVDISSGRPLEADVTTTKGSYRMTLQLHGGAWLAVERQLLQDNVP
jgi:hypothetical protein